MNIDILDKKSWGKLRGALNNSYQMKDGWANAIDKFKRRIENYYLSPIAKIKEPKDLKGEGFSILTIQCALIEMFAAFKYGKIHNHRKPDNGLKFEYKKADDCFIKFLHDEAIFENHFYTLKNNVKITGEPFRAKDFYTKVRCGLMHECRTKEEWRINAKKSDTNANDKIFIIQKDGNIIINRNILNDSLINYFTGYINDLKLNNEKGNQLRRLFGRKLDHLFDISRDKEFDWWKDR